MKNKAESITKYQLLYMILQTQIGVGVLSLPHSVNKAAGSDGWISVLIAGVLVQLLILLIWFLSKRYPDQTIFGITEKALGKWIGKCIGFVYVLYAILTCTLILVLFQGILKLWVLPNTPSWIILFIMIGTSIFLVKDRIRVIARFYMFVMVLVPPLIILTIISFPSVAEYRYLFPIGSAGMISILKGAHAVLISMLGFEMLFLLFPYVQATDKQILKSVSIASGVTTLLYLYLVLVSFIVFSPKEIQLVPQPVLYMLKAITFQIVERIDLLFISIWIVVVATSFMSYLLFSSIGIQHIFNLKRHTTAFYFIVPATFIGAMIPRTEFHVGTLSRIVEFTSYVLIVIIPVCLLVVSIIQSKRKSRRYKG
jgi:spore germination protein (amino acid permease)